MSKTIEVSSYTQKPIKKEIQPSVLRIESTLLFADCLFLCKVNVLSWLDVKTIWRTSADRLRHRLSGEMYAH